MLLVELSHSIHQTLPVQQIRSELLNLVRTNANLHTLHHVSAECTDAVAMARPSPKPTGRLSCQRLSKTYLFQRHKTAPTIPSVVGPHPRRQSI